MKYLKNYIVLISILAVMLSSCSIDEESTTSATTSTTSVAPISDYNGTFNGTCAGADARTWKMVITDTTAAEIMLVYSDSGCTSEVWSYTLNYTVESTASATSDGGKSVTKIKGTTTTSSLTLSTDQYVSNANSSSWCGKTGWVKGTAKDVSGLDCSSSLGQTFGAAGVTKYDIWYLSGTTFLNSGGFDSDGYPTSLGDVTYTKQ